MLNPYIRYQKGLTLQDLFPLRNDGLCACGCGLKLNGLKKRWFSSYCQQNAVDIFFIVKGSSIHIRKQLEKRDNGRCACCNSSNVWHADHILPVKLGGGACDLDNLQTLCVNCHLKKHHSFDHHNAISSHAEAI